MRAINLWARICAWWRREIADMAPKSSLPEPICADPEACDECASCYLRVSVIPEAVKVRQRSEWASLEPVDDPTRQI